MTISFIYQVVGIRVSRSRLFKYLKQHNEIWNFVLDIHEAMDIKKRELPIKREELQPEDIPNFIIRYAMDTLEYQKKLFPDTNIKAIRIPHDVDETCDFIVGIVMSEIRLGDKKYECDEDDEDEEKIINNVKVSISDILNTSKQMALHFKSLGFDESVDLYTTQDECNCCS